MKTYFDNLYKPCILLLCGTLSVFFLYRSCALGAESSVFLDLKTALEEHSSGFYDEQTRTILLQMVRARINQVKAEEEKQKVKEMINIFVTKGFQSGNASLFLFSDEHTSLRNELLENVIQKSPYALNEQFLKEMYKKYQDSPGTYFFDCFKNGNWIEFSSRYKNNETFQSLQKLLDSNTDVSRYLSILYYGYRCYRERNGELDAHVQKRYLDAQDINISKINTFYSELNQSYWSGANEKKEWMLAKTAQRLYYDFSPVQWCELSPSIVLDLAKILAKTNINNTQSPGLMNWYDKIGSSIKENPQERLSVRSLLAYFLSNSGMDLRTSFLQLSRQFSNDQAMFIALHNSPPDPSAMAIWHGVPENISDCINMLSNFFALANENAWTISLWECMRDYYYRKYPLWRTALFQKIITPIYQQASANNSIRKKLIYETQNTQSFLIDAHRYEIAHYLFLRHKMSEHIIMEDSQGIESLEFTIKVYEDLDYADEQLYEAPSLYKKGLILLQTDKDRILVYINQIIGEPLEKVCYAFMGKTEKTGGEVFDFDNATRTGQLERLLKRIVFLKGILRSEYNYVLTDVPVLRDISQKIIEEMKKAIIEKQPAKIIKLTKLTLKITVILEDDSYLERVLVALRKDVFGVSEDPYLFRKLPPDELKLKVEYFSQIHSEDLIEAIRAIGKIKYLRIFYENLYIPLRSIYNFFASTGSEPFERFVNEFYDGGQKYGEKVSLDDILSLELQSLGAIRDSDGKTGYINAESAIADILHLYYEKLGINLWEATEKVVLSKNVNVGVLYRLLVEEQKDSWRLGKLSNQDRSKCYKKVASIFFDIMRNPEMMERPVSNDASYALYTKWEFFKFLTSLVTIYEIYGFPFENIDTEALYTGDPIEGIKLKNIVYDGSNLSIRKVDGSLRSKLYKQFKDVQNSGVSEKENSRNWEDIVDIVLLLPNMTENNAGDFRILEEYHTIKREVFETTVKSQLEGSRHSLEHDHTNGERCRKCEEITNALIWLCRLEASIYALGSGNTGFGYQEMRDKYLNEIGQMYQKKILWEESRLIQVNQVSAQTQFTDTLSISASVVSVLLKGFRSSYELLKERGDSISQEILNLYKMVTPSKIIEGLRDDDVDNLWFLTIKYRDLLNNVVSHKNQLRDNDKKLLAQLTSDVFEVYCFFLPYIHSEFTIDTLLHEKHKNALCVFSMINREVKKPLVNLLTINQGNDNSQVHSLSAYEEGYEFARKDTHSLVMTPREIKTFLICHNFLPVLLLEKCLGDLKAFERLIEGEELKVETYNFRLLWKIEDIGKVSMENLCGEVMDGVELNKDILTSGTYFGDAQYLEYFFGNMRLALNDLQAARQKTQWEMPENFNSIVWLLAKLPSDKRFEDILSTLKKRLELLNDTKDIKENDKKKLQEALKTAQEFPQIIQKILSRGYEYFGVILVNKFNSIYGIQRACECVRKSIEESEKNQVEGPCKKLYSNFYYSGLFDGSSFKGELYYAMIKKFYCLPKPGEESSGYLQKKYKDFWTLIDGTAGQGSSFILENDNELYKAKSSVKKKTEGLIVTIRKPETIRNEFEKRYVNSFLDLFQGLFRGDGLDKDISFIGIVAWDKDKEGNPTIIPLDYDRREGEIRSLLRWIYESAKKYEKIPEFRQLFVEPDFAVSENLE